MKFIITVGHDGNDNRQWDEKYEYDHVKTIDQAIEPNAMSGAILRCSDKKGRATHHES